MGSMFYGWEEFNGGAGEPLLVEPSGGEHGERGVAQSEVATIVAHLQRQLESTTAALRSEQARHAETIARNRELERELADRVRREHGLENEVRRLQKALQTLEDAEERLVAQLADLEADALEQNRHFSAEIISLSQTLSGKEQALAAALSEVESYRHRQVSLKELEAMDLASELLKSTHECDRMKEEVERVRSEATSLHKELALAKLVRAIQEERSASVPSQLLCRSESARLVTPRRTRHATLAV